MTYISKRFALKVLSPRIKAYLISRVNFALKLSIISSILCLPLFAKAEENQSLIGLKADSIIRLLGKPDRSVAINSKKDYTIWYYGDSIVAFRNKKVSMISDRNNLDIKYRFKLLTDSSYTSSNSTANAWINEWTPQEKSSRNQVLDSLLSDL